MLLAAMTSRALQIGQLSTEEGGTGALIENPEHVQSSMAINEIKFKFNFNCFRDIRIPDSKIFFAGAPTNHALKRLLQNLHSEQLIPLQIKRQGNIAFSYHI